MKKKKCKTCWSYVNQQDWKTEQEKGECMACLLMRTSCEALHHMAKAQLNRNVEITWKFIKK